MTPAPPSNEGLVESQSNDSLSSNATVTTGLVNRRLSNTVSMAPTMTSAAPSDRVQASHFTPPVFPRTFTSQSMRSISSINSDCRQDDGDDDDDEDEERDDVVDLPYGYKSDSQTPGYQTDYEALDQVAELGDFSYARSQPRHIGSSFASDWDNDSNPERPRSVFSDVASMFHPNEYIAAQQREQGYDGESDYDIESTSGTNDDRQSRRTSMLSVASGRPSMLSNYGAIPNLSGISSIPGARHSHLNMPYSLSMERTDTGASAITIREALVSHSTNPGSNLGLVLMAISQVSYSTMNMFVKLLDEREGEPARERDYNTQPPLGALEIVGVECLIIYIGCVLAMTVARTEHILIGPPGARMALLFRGVFGFTSTLALYIGLQNLSLSDATVISFLAPLATGLIANIFLKEPFTLRERIAGIFSLCGVMLIARPSFLFGTPSDDETLPPMEGDLPETGPGMGGDGSEAQRLFGIAVALLGVLLTSGAWVSLRSIGKKASTYHSIAYFSLCSWTCSFLAMWILGELFIIPETIESDLLLISVGIFSLLAQVFQTLGLQRESAARAATMSYLQIIFALFWQLTLFGTPLEWLSLFGSALILVNGAWVALSKDQDDDTVAMH